MPLRHDPFPDDYYDRWGLKPEYEHLLEERGLSAEEVVLAWRAAYPEIVKGWRTCHNALPAIAQGMEVEIDPWGLTHTSRHGIHLPSGRIIHYPDLRQVVNQKDGKVEWVYGWAKKQRRIYAGKVTENIVQAIARDSIFDCALEFFKLTGLRPALRVHDELIYVVPQNRAEELLRLLQGVMRQPPRWWRELVVWSEGDLARTYGDAK